MSNTAESISKRIIALMNSRSLVHESSSILVFLLMTNALKSWTIAASTSKSFLTYREAGRLGARARVALVVELLGEGGEQAAV